MDDHRTKLAWARKHLEGLQRAIDRFLTSDPCDAAVERQPGTHSYRVRFYVKSEIPIEWSSMVGDIVHNARSALDTLAYSLVLAHHGTPTAEEVTGIQFLLADSQADI
jgi:hypothetical protein